MADTLHPLADKQADAVVPEDNVWLSASAGTGKTQVLTARVFRLLLRENVDPEQILCLTFTKAGAAEMAERVHRQLAAWVRMPQKDLRQQLFAIGASNDPPTQERARTLFARVLDARGGGLRIMTIHSFCQALLGSFPEEAGIASSFKPIEERDQKILARQSLGEMLLEEEAQGRSEFTSAVQALSIRMGEEAAEQYLMRCASKADAMEALPEGSLLPFVQRLLGLSIVGDVKSWLAEQCADDVIDRKLMETLSNAMAENGGKKEQERQRVINHWLTLTNHERAGALQDLHHAWTTKTTGASHKPTKALLAALPEYEEVTGQLMAWSSELLDTMTLFEYADLLSGALNAGRAFHHRYSRAKKLQGLVDFDDMIRITARLLRQGDMAHWIRYKLDQRTDHILVDEAQDTNQAQWEIVHALADEFFAGKGAQDDKLRTLFTVGDFKQAIFGFQGTSPHNYTKAREEFLGKADASEKPFHQLSLDRSFRSTPPILKVVDETLCNIGHDQLGLDEAIPQHRSHFSGESGSVSLWRPIAFGVNADAEDEESWIDDEKRVFANKLALQIKNWLSPKKPLWLAREGRPLEPKDVLILVSKRDELSALIVARLFAENVPVAGIDRIRLNQPLVVQDLLAAVRFVLQPNDDLNLANLLVSPLLGWSQEDLLKHGYRGEKYKDQHLWEFLRRQDELKSAIQPLRDLLNIADFNTPYQFLETILSGEMQGRNKLSSRLGHAAIDPIEELLNTALAFEQDHIPTLQGFLDWFDRGDVDIKRDQVEGGNEVRLMTVHGAKGLQAPVVIMANATFDPANKRNGTFDIADPMRLNENIEYPAVPVRKSERVKLLDAYATVAEERELEEHWRLLYVAMTRAEEHLVVAGTLGPKANGVVPELSWYGAVERGLMGLNCDWQDNRDWIAERRYTAGRVSESPKTLKDKDSRQRNERIPLPDWVRQPAPKEARPPKPLAPSDLGADTSANPPPSEGMQAAAQRGVLLHSLFQRLPDIDQEKRADVGDRWLKNQKGVSSKDERDDLINTVLSVLNNPAWATLFEPDGLAEAPIAAAVGESVISGTVDRLLIAEDQIYVVDFKTGRRVPERIEDAPVAYLRQMSAYVSALGKIFPGRPIKAGLLYSQGPIMLEITEELIERYKPGLGRP